MVLEILTWAQPILIILGACVGAEFAFRTERRRKLRSFNAFLKCMMVRGQ